MMGRQHALFFLLASAITAQAAPLLTLSAAQIQASGIRFEPVVAAQAGQGLPFNGQVEAAADSQWVVTAPLAGVVTRLRVAEGDSLSKQQVMLEIASPEAPALAAEFKRSQSAAKLAAAERQRDRALHAEGIIAARRLEASEQKAIEADADFAAARQQLNLLGISPSEASRGHVSLRAPASARVISRTVQLGQRVNAGDALLQLADPQHLVLSLSVPVTESQRFQRGQRLRLSDPQTDHELGINAEVQQVGWGSASAGSQIRVRASLRGDVSMLRPGQWLRARTLAAQPAPAPTKSPATLTVPTRALLGVGKQHYLFLARPTGVQPVAVTRLDSGSERSQVQGAVSVNDRVAVSGLITLKSLLQAAP